MDTPILLQVIFWAAALIYLYYRVRLAMNERSIRRVNSLAAAGEYKEAVDRLYSMIWVGTPEDEGPAWDRVIAYLNQNGYCKAMVKEAELRWLARLFFGTNVRYSDKTVVLI